jgi:regulator of protease activity HflC (stomatin/prohibitin superfamily)
MSACPSAFPAQITAAVAVSAATEAEQRQEAEMERRREKQAKAERATGRRAPVRSARGDAENAIGLGHALVEAPTYSPSSGPQRLRRVKGTTFGLGHGLSGLGHGSPPMVAPTARSAAAVGRRISFGSAPRGRDLCASVHSPYSQEQDQRHPTADETAAAILAEAEAARGLEGAFQLR